MGGLIMLFTCFRKKQHPNCRFVSYVEKMLFKRSGFFCNCVCEVWKCAYYVPASKCVHVLCVCLHMYRGQKRAPGALYHSPSIPFRQGLSLNLELEVLVGSRQGPTMLMYPPTHALLGFQAHERSFLSHRCWDLNSGPLGK